MSALGGNPVPSGGVLGCTWHSTPPGTPPEGTRSGRYLGPGIPTILPVARMTDICETITFLQLRWWTVIMVLLP